MGQQYRAKRRADVVSSGIADNSVFTINLPRAYDLESIYIHVIATATLTGAGAAVRAMAPTQLIKRVELVADGKNTIASIPGWALVKNFGREHFGAMVPPASALAVAHAVEFFGTLDQALIDGVRPKDSNLRTNGMQQLALRFTMGAAIDMFTNGGALAGTLTALTVDVGICEMIELPDAKGAVSSPLYLQKRSYQDIAIPASNANQQVVLPIGNALRGVQILTTVAGEPSDAVLNNVRLESGLDVRVNLPAAMLKRSNFVDFAPMGPQTGTTSWAASGGTPVGLYVVDLMTNGPRDVNVTNAWDLSKASEAKLVLDVVGGATTQMTVVTTEFIQ